VSALACKIAQRLVDLGKLDANVYDIEKSEIYRTHAGVWQRRGGAWSWALELVRKDGGIVYDSYGSQFTATECAKAKEWDYYSTGIDHGIIPLKEEK
jgi:hypothetical protein